MLLSSPVKVLPSALALGEVVEGNSVTFTVHIVNNTNQTLQLVRVNASACGCLFERQKLPKLILPQSKVPIAFNLRTDNLPDPFRQQLTFILTNPLGTTFSPTLVLTGKVVRELIFNPSFLDFGTVLLGGA